MRRLPLRDINNLEAYVRGAVKRTFGPELKADDREDRVQDGLEIAIELEQRLPAGESLRGALAACLDHRLRDRWRQMHPEYRRNTRAGTTRTAESLPFDDDHVALDEHIRRSDREAAEIQSRLSLERFGGAADLRDPRVVGAYVGVPSHFPAATGVSIEIAAAIEAEREALAWRPSLEFGFTKEI